MNAEEGNNHEPSSNPFVAWTNHFFEAVAPGSLDDPGRAWRELVPQLRFSVIANVPHPAPSQLQALRRFSEFEQCNLLQVRRSLQKADLRLGPFPQNLTQPLIESLVADGFMVSIKELTAHEQAEQLDGLENPPPYLSRT